MLDEVYGEFVRVGRFDDFAKICGLACTIFGVFALGMGGFYLMDFIALANFLLFQIFAIIVILINHS